MAFLEPSSYATLRRQFAAQFDDEDSRLVFRANGSGAAIPVSAAERDMFIADYDRFLSRWRWTMILWLVPGLLIAVAILVALDVVDGPWLYGSIVAAIAPGLIYSIRSSYRARTVPKQALAQRPAVSPALTRDVARRKGLRAIPWPTLALAPAYAAFLAWRYGVLASPLAPKHLFWTLLAGGMIVLSARQAVGKWRAEQLGMAKA